MDANIEKEIEDGARKSREASSVPEFIPLPLRLWAKHRWLIIAIALFLLIDIIVLGALGGVGGHF